MACVALACGCSTGGGDVGAAVDPTLVTSDVPRAEAQTEQLSDQATIRDAVTSADLEAAGGQALAWANAETGSRGAITALAENRKSGELCRSFTTSRESYDGVAIYSGEACKSQNGPWRMLQFKPL